MASLTDLIRRSPGKGTKTSTAKAKAPDTAEPEAAREDPMVDGARRLAFLIEHDRLPPYLRVVEGAAVADENHPNQVATQARKEWPNVAKNLCVAVGEVAGDAEGGVLIRTGGRVLKFSLVDLWSANGLYY